MFKCLFTGNLNKKVISVPPFPGCERHLLRCQLARITHATQVVPKGIFDLDEESGNIKTADEAAVPGTEELKSLENWVHRYPVILKSGKCKAQAAGGEEGEGAEGEDAANADPDLAVEKLRDI